jgi:hypothetical protein
MWLLTSTKTMLWNSAGRPVSLHWDLSQSSMSPHKWQAKALQSTLTFCLFQYTWHPVTERCIRVDSPPASLSRGLGSNLGPLNDYADGGVSWFSSALQVNSEIVSQIRTLWLLSSSSSVHLSLIIPSFDTISTEVLEASLNKLQENAKQTTFDHSTPNNFYRDCSVVKQWLNYH